MHIFDRLVRAFFALLVAIAPAAADSQPVTVTGWTEIGAGTVIVNSLSREGVYLQDSATQPTAATGSVLIPFGAISPPLTTTTKWWAKPGTNAQTTLIGVQRQGAQTTSDVTYSQQAHAYAQATSTASAQSFSQMSVSVPAWATMVFVIPSADIRYRCDGVAPTASVGMPISAGQAWPIQGAASLAACKFIGPATLNAEFRG